jgi:hypothetical protein
MIHGGFPRNSTVSVWAEDALLEFPCPKGGGILGHDYVNLVTSHAGAARRSRS